jgi:hypothetical protein
LDGLALALLLLPPQPAIASATSGRARAEARKVVRLRFMARTVALAGEGAMNGFIARSCRRVRLSPDPMALLISIGIGFLGVAAVVLIQSVAGDVIGAVLVIVALVALIRSVIRLAGEAGTPSDSVSSSSGSSPEATSRFR